MDEKTTNFFAGIDIFKSPGSNLSHTSDFSMKIGGGSVFITLAEKRKHEIAKEGKSVRELLKALGWKEVLPDEGMWEFKLRK